MSLTNYITNTKVEMVFGTQLACLGYLFVEAITEQTQWETVKITANHKTHVLRFYVMCFQCQRNTLTLKKCGSHSSLIAGDEPPC